MKSSGRASSKRDHRARHPGVETVKHPRTTHSDLATLLEDLAVKLAKVPSGFCVSDASTLLLLMDAARILREQDGKVAELTIALREHGGRAGRQALGRING